MTTQAEHETRIHAAGVSLGRLIRRWLDLSEASDTEFDKEFDDIHYDMEREAAKRTAKQCANELRAVLGIKTRSK